jgi:CDP-glycerol glycerophosphotransferase
LKRTHIAYMPGIRRLPGALGPVEQDVVYFESWHGKYSDNPRAISEEISRRGLPITQVWLTDGSTLLPSGVIGVPPDGWGYVRRLRRSGLLINNATSLPLWYRKRAGARYLQTWHGTPLKRIGFDIENPHFRDWDAYVRHLRFEVAAWDYLISPNRFSTEIMRRAFGFEGPILETGYPRNDILVGGRASAVRAAVRAQLGLQDAETAVLYAPTWRDGQQFRLTLDAERLVSEIEGVRLLLRTHVMFADRVRLDRGPAIMDVSRYPEIAELYLAADVLVTDYSSAMFDYAVTGKPMLFFTYDLEEYRDTLRGFYFEFEADAPGPLLADTDAVIEALRALPDVQRRSAGSYERFRARFCHLDDGTAAARVVQAVLGV